MLGVDVKVDASWALIALLIGYSFFFQFRLVYPSLSTWASVGLAVGETLVFFGSVLAHELAHAVVAKARGIPVRDITLFLFGGVTRARVESHGPGEEFLIAVVGPVTSLVVGGALWAVAILVPGLPDAVAGAIGYLGLVNLALGVFNLVPGFPLDGGRLLRSTLWKTSGDLGRATRIAAAVGQVVGWLMVAGGLALVATVSLIGGIWIAAIGWFLVQAARASYADLRIRTMLEVVDAEEVMTETVVTVPTEITIQEAVDRYLRSVDVDAVPVQQDGRTVGILTVEAVRRLGREHWDDRRVGEIMAPLVREPRVDAKTRMDRVVRKLEDVEGQRVFVARGAQVVGVITSGDISRWVTGHRGLEREHDRKAA